MGFIIVLTILILNKPNFFNFYFATSYFLCVLYLYLIQLISPVILILFPPTFITNIFFIPPLIFLSALPVVAQPGGSNQLSKWTLGLKYFTCADIYYSLSSIVLMVFYWLWYFLSLRPDKLYSCCMWFFHVKEGILPGLHNFTIFTYTNNGTNINPAKWVKYY